MDKQRLQQPLHVVKRVTHTGEMYDPVFTGSKVIFGCIDEGNSEVEHQIDDQRTGILGQEDLRKRQKAGQRESQLLHII